MGRQLLQLTKKSMKRRWREIWRACMATFLAVFFITGVLLFQENMYQWQLASNKERYGDWLIMETNTGIPNPIIVDHPLMDGYEVAESALKLYSNEWKEINRYVGYMSPEFLAQSYIDVEVGRMPKADDEVAVDWDTLLRMGITAELGQTVTIYYYEGNNLHDVNNRRREEFTLVGILESYTDTWKVGKNLPGVLVTKSRYEAYDNNAQNMFIHRIKSNVKTDDYRLLFDSIKEESGSHTPIYNDYLYEYKPWGSDLVYNYMYLVVMLIGIAAIIYQLMIYNNLRKRTYKIMRNMGAEKAQVALISIMENTFVLAVPGLIGIAMAAMFGKVLCLFIEIPMGISFYYVKWSILFKGFLSIVLAAIIQFVLEKLVIFRGDVLSAKALARKSHEIVKTKSERKLRKVINSANLTRQLSFRLTAANSWMQNVAIRLLALSVCVVIVFCSLKINHAYIQYKNNKNLPDFVGYQEEENTYDQVIYTYIPFEVDEGQSPSEAYSEFLEGIQGNGDASNRFYRELMKIPTAEERKKLINSGGETRWRIFDDGKSVFLEGIRFASNCKYIKSASTGLGTGISDRVIETIEETIGVQSVTYSNYESRRSWSWDGMTMDNMSVNKLIQTSSSEKIQPYCNKYLFATQYQKPTEELYEKLSKYIDKDFFDYEAFCKGDQVVVFVDENLDEKFDDSIKPGMELNYHYYPVFSDIEYYNLIREVYGEIYYKDLYEMELSRREMYGACMTPKVAGVVYVTDEVEEEFKDLIVGFGYYTAIASTQLGQRLCDNQNAFAEECLQQELPEDKKMKMSYNQMTIIYDLAASFSATNNIIENFCKENNITYNALTEEKETYRTELINAIFMYGITLIAAIVINALVVAVIAKSRLESRKQRFMLMTRLGTEQSRIIAVCMIEAVREAIWCVFTMPLILLIQYMICRKATEQTNEKKSFKILIVGISVAACLILGVVIAALVVVNSDKDEIAKETGSEEQSEVATTNIYTGNTLEQFEENGEKYYKEISESVEMIYRRFDKKIVSKEEIKSGIPMNSISHSKDGAVHQQFDLFNIYDESVREVTFTMYNVSAYFAGKESSINPSNGTYRLCDSYTVNKDNLTDNYMATLHMIYEFEGRRVEGEAIEASIVDKAVIQADITYMDGSVKTEYMSLSSNGGRNCNSIKVYRLQVEE